MVKWLKCFRRFQVRKGARNSKAVPKWCFQDETSEAPEPLCGSRLNTVSWPIGFLISAGNPTCFTGWAMGLLVCASLAGPSYQVPLLLAGQWLLGLCFAGWSIFVIPSLAGWPMTARLCIIGWPIVTSPTPASWPVVARPVPRWLAHLSQSLPCRLADAAARLCITAGPW